MPRPMMLSMGGVMKIPIVCWAGDGSRFMKKRSPDFFRPPNSVSCSPSDYLTRITREMAEGIWANSPKVFSTADGNAIRAHHSVIVFTASPAAITYTDRVAIRQAAPHFSRVRVGTHADGLHLGGFRVALYPVRGPIRLVGGRTRSNSASILWQPAGNLASARIPAAVFLRNLIRSMGPGKLVVRSGRP